MSIPDTLNVNATLKGDADEPLPIVAVVSGGNDPIGLALEGLNDINIDVGGTSTPIGLQVSSPPNEPVVVDVGLDDINVDVGGTATPVGLEFSGGERPVTVDLGLDDINLDMGLDKVNVCLSLAVTEIPRVRVHLPTKYEFGFNILGMSIFNFILKGEMMLVTEDNPPRIFYQPEEPSEPPGNSARSDDSENHSDATFTMRLDEEVR